MSLKTKLGIALGVALLAFIALLMHPPKAAALVYPNPAPARGMPANQYGPGPGTMISCDSQPNSPWLGEWMASASGPTVTTITVPNGYNAPLGLGFYWSAMACHSYATAVSASRIVLLAVYNPNTVGLLGDQMTLSLPAPNFAGSYGETADPFTLNPPLGGYTNTTPGFYSHIPVGFKMVNRFTNGAYRCVLPPGISTWGFTPTSLDDWGGCPATTIDFQINIVVQPPPSLDRSPTVTLTPNCSAQTATIRVSDPDGGPLSARWLIRPFGTSTGGTWTDLPLKTGSPATWTVSLAAYSQTAKWKMWAESRGHAPPGATLGGWVSDVKVIDPCPTVIPSNFTCTISPPSAEAGAATVFRFGIQNNSPPGGASISQAAGNTMDLKLRGPLPGSTIVYQGTNVNYGAPPPGPTVVPPGSTGIHEETITLPTVGTYYVEMNVSGIGLVGGCDTSSNTVTAVNKPYVSFYGGDIFSGGGFRNGMAGCTTFNSSISTLNRPDNAGSGNQLAAFSLGSITGSGFTTASMRASSPTPQDGLKFANTPSTGSFNTPHCITDYYSAATGGAFGSNDVGGGGASGSYKLGGGSTLHGTVPLGRRYVIFVNGDLNIDGNITYATNLGSWPSTADIPSLYVVVKGNIYIDSGVTQLDGVYIAQPDTPPTTLANDNLTKQGRIYTCTSGFSVVAGNSLYASCNTQLNVNGAFIAQQVKLQRTYKSLRDASPGEYSPSNGAEVFRFTPELYISPPDLPNSASTNVGTYDAIANLPPVL